MIPAARNWAYLQNWLMLLSHLGLMLWAHTILTQGHTMCTHYLYISQKWDVPFSFNEVKSLLWRCLSYFTRILKYLLHILMRADEGLWLGKSKILAWGSMLCYLCCNCRLQYLHWMQQWPLDYPDCIWHLLLSLLSSVPFIAPCSHACFPLPCPVIKSKVDDKDRVGRAPLF